MPFCQMTIMNLIQLGWNWLVYHSLIIPGLFILCILYLYLLSFFQITELYLFFRCEIKATKNMMLVTFIFYIFQFLLQTQKRFLTFYFPAYHSFQDSKLDVTIGPYETYEDAIFGYKVHVDYLCLWYLCITCFVGFKIWIIILRTNCGL